MPGRIPRFRSALMTRSPGGEHGTKGKDVEPFSTPYESIKFYPDADHFRPIADAKGRPPGAVPAGHDEVVGAFFQHPPVLLIDAIGDQIGGENLSPVGMAGELKIDADGLRLLQIKGLVIHQDKGLLAIDALHHILQRDPVRPPFGGGDRSGRSDRNHRRRKRSDPSKTGSLPLPEPSST